jgi:hypothetical protein
MFRGAKGIADEINHYLFDLCFDPRASSGYECLPDYLVISYCSSFGFTDQIDPEVAANEFTKAQIQIDVRRSWQNHRE